MQRICSSCNTLVTGEGSFCPTCGALLPAAVDLDKQPAPQSVQFTASAQVSSDTPIAKKRYCQAMIIIQCISVALSIIFFIVFFAILGAAGNSFSDILSEMT